MSDYVLEPTQLKMPEESRFRVPTLNRFGYMFTKFDPIVDRWLQSVTKNPDQVLFEVGGALAEAVKKLECRRFCEDFLADFKNHPHPQRPTCRCGWG